MNKKLIFAMGLTTMMAACSNEDVLTDVQNSQELDMFAGIEKVDANFNWGIDSRLNTQFGLEIGDEIGLAWLTDSVNGGVLDLTGTAYQNHPLFAETTNSLKPKTSIYVGEYFSYAPYDNTVVNIKNINFSIPEVQDMLATWNSLAKTSIYISPKWTSVSDADTDDGVPGRDKTFQIYPRKFSNSARLNFTYENNEVDLKDETDNDKVVAADPQIFDIEVSYIDAQGNVASINKFQYAPTEEPDTLSWEQHMLAESASLLATTGPRAAVELKVVEGIKNTVPGAYRLEPKEDYVADREKDGDIFRFNALPALTDVDENTTVKIEANTTYGKVTIEKAVNEIAYTAFQKKDGTTGFYEQPDGITEDLNGPLEEGTYFDYTESFVQVLGKNGEFNTEFDFSTAVMDSMHVVDNDHLLKLLRYYRDYKMGTDYEELDVQLLLDGDDDEEFKISKAAIELTRSINQSTGKTSGTPLVSLVMCKEHNCEDLVLIDGGEIPEFHQVFYKNYPISLSDEYTWTWGGSLARSAEDATKNMGRVTKIFNRGTLNVNSDMNTKGNAFNGLVNNDDATINVNVKMEANINVYNKGVMNIAEEGEFWAGNGYELINEAESLEEFGTINNAGVITVTDTVAARAVATRAAGQIVNYGLINHQSDKNEYAKTYITSNQTSGADFTNPFEKDENMFGTIMLDNKFDNISVSNETEEGFIKYAWNAAEDSESEDNIYQTPMNAYYKIKYNYLIIDQNIKFVEPEKEIKFLEVAAGKKVVIAAEEDPETQYEGLGLVGFILADKAEANIQLQNTVGAYGAYITKGIVRVGGIFDYGTLVTYLGGNTTDNKNIGKYGN